MIETDHAKPFGPGVAHEVEDRKHAASKGERETQAEEDEPPPLVHVALDACSPKFGHKSPISK